MSGQCTRCKATIRQGDGYGHLDANKLYCVPCWECRALRKVLQGIADVVAFGGEDSENAFYGSDFEAHFEAAENILAQVN